MEILKPITLMNEERVSPAADLLYSDIDGGLKDLILSSVYFGERTIDDFSVDHLSFENVRYLHRLAELELIDGEGFESLQDELQIVHFCTR